jgi:hypothetical protein
MPIAWERALEARTVFLAGLLAVSMGRDGWADCLADFNAINSQRRDTARYAMEVSADVLSPEDSVVKHMASSSLFDLTDGVRMKTSGLNTQADFILIGEEGWTLAAGQWTPMPAEQVKLALEGVVANRYVYDRDARDFECPGEAGFEGKPHESFVFNQTVGALENRVTAWFDPATRLPVAVVSNAEVNGYKVVATTRYRFDPAIRVEIPR